MIVCDNCNVCVTKHTFCSDKCRVAYHRRNDNVTNEAKTTKNQTLDSQPRHEAIEAMTVNLGKCENGKINPYDKCSNPAIKTIKIENENWQQAPYNLCETHYNKFIQETS